jgi:hypothetical protein
MRMLAPRQFALLALLCSITQLAHAQNPRVSAPAWEFRMNGRPPGGWTPVSITSCWPVIQRLLLKSTARPSLWFNRLIRQIGRMLGGSRSSGGKA